MPKVASAIQSVIRVIMSICLWSIPLCGLITMVMYMVSYPEHFSVSDLPVLLASILGILIALKYIKIRWTHLKYWVTGCFVLLNTLLAVSLVSYDTGLCSDYLALWRMAASMADGTYSAAGMACTDYGYMFNYQNGIAAFISLFIRCFGPTLWPLKIFNVILINISALLTYRVCRVMSDHRSATAALLLFCTFYPVLITVNQFTNQHIAMVMTLAVLLLLHKGGYFRWIVAGILVGVMDVLRPEGAILIMTALVYALYAIFSQSAKRSMVRPALSFALMLVCYCGVSRTADCLFMDLGYTAVPLSQKTLPYFKFDKGLTGYDFPEIDAHGGTIEDFNRWEKDKLTDIAIHSPMTIVKYVTGKMIRYQGEFDWKFENTYDHNPDVYNHYPIKAFVYFGWAQYLIFAVLAAYGYARWSRKRGPDVFVIFYIGITSVYLFIEAFSSYRYESYPILFVFAGIGWGLWPSHNQSQERG